MTRLCLACIVSVFLLAGCACHSTPVQRTTKQKLGYGEFCPKHQIQFLLKRLKHYGARVEFFGDHLILITPDQKVFQSRSYRLVANGSDLLNVIAQFLKCYQKVSVKVVVYTNVLKTPKDNQVFSQERAEHLTKYLWKKGIDTRLLYAEGGGIPKTRDVFCGNRRIEIITQRLP